MCANADPCKAGAFADLREDILSTFTPFRPIQIPIAPEPTIPMEELEMSLGFNKPLPEMSKEELAEEIKSLRAERAARTDAKRVAKKKKVKEVDELHVTLKQVPEDELKAFMEAWKEKKGGN